MVLKASKIVSKDDGGDEDPAIVFSSKRSTDGVLWDPNNNKNNNNNNEKDKKSNEKFNSKKQPCKFFLKSGYCRKGARCPFPHVPKADEK